MSQVTDYRLVNWKVTEDGFSLLREHIGENFIAAFEPRFLKGGVIFIDLPIYRVAEWEKLIMSRLPTPPTT